MTFNNWRYFCVETPLPCSVYMFVLVTQSYYSEREREKSESKFNEKRDFNWDPSLAVDIHIKVVRDAPAIEKRRKTSK